LTNLPSICYSWYLNMAISYTLYACKHL